MPKPSDFPRLNLCDACSRLFTDYDDGVRFNSIQHYMWYEKEGYTYSRIRKDLEHAAASGCMFCKGVLGRDSKYWENSEDGDKPEPCFEHPRPPWYPPLDEEINLAMRYDWIDNMLYFRNYGGIDWFGGDLTWSMYATPDDPISSRVHAQAILRDLRSEKSFAEARGWMTECFTNHDNCPRNEPVDLPTRLIKVSPLGEAESARLCETSGKKGFYCALSYCWGGDQEHKTLVERYDEYKTGLPYSRLPKTIADAIYVTRNMGLEYIWIDSLCIIQDSDEDKQAEMGKMMHIYQNTQFTISVASAKSVKDGFLDPRLDGPDLNVFYQPIRADKHTMGSVFISNSGVSFASASTGKQHINTRSWTLQESILTPRLLTFSSIHMIWKCQTGYEPDFHSTFRDKREKREHNRSDKDGPWRPWANFAGYMSVPLKDLAKTATPEAPKTDEAFDACRGMYSTWHSILGEYTIKELTVESDRLPAIAGVAQAFATHFKSEYYAGLWGNFLVFDLMWSNWLSDSAVTKTGFPSWSWTTINGKHSYQLGNTNYAVAEVISCETLLVSESNPFGAVTAGKLVIRGHLKRMWIEPEKSGVYNDDGELIKDAEFITDGALKDYKPESEDESLIEVWGLVLGESPGAVLHTDYPNCCSGGECRNDESLECRMMVLIDYPPQKGYYYRIGLVKAESYHAPYWWEDCERVTVKIV